MLRGAVSLRLLMMLVNAFVAAGRGPALETRLSSVALLLVGLGFSLGLWMASRGGWGRDLPAAALAGGMLGLPAAAITFAVMHSTEAMLGSWSSSFWAVGLLWAGLGAAAALGSILLIPHVPNHPETA